MNRHDIETVSALIQGAKLLGGKYHADRDSSFIHLPCGRVVLCRKHPDQPRWKFEICDASDHIDVDQSASPEQISRHVRKFVVAHDDLTEPR